VQLFKTIVVNKSEPKQKEKEEVLITTVVEILAEVMVETAVVENRGGGNRGY
jgi:hypothetical protein